MFSIDKNKLFLGVAYPFYDICHVYPLQIKQVIGMGEDEYNRRLGMLIMEKRDIEKNLQQSTAPAELFNLSVFEYLLLVASFNEQFFLELHTAFSTFIKEEIFISIDTKEIFIGDINEKRIINEENFEDFQMILRAQNDLPIPEPVPKNESPMARKFRLRKEQRLEAKRREALRTGEQLDLCDTISCLICLNVGLSLEEIKNLSIYAFREVFKRAQRKYAYDLDIRMIAAGADPKKVRPKNWLGKLED